MDLQRFPFRQFATYVVNGIIANGIDIGGFWLLERTGLWYMYASFISSAAGFLAAFFLHKHVAFKAQGKAVQHFVKFCLLGAFNIVAVAAVLFVCVEWIGLPELPAKIIANGSQALWGFILMKFAVYT